MREIKFREEISYQIDDIYITTNITFGRSDSKGWYKENGYIMRKVNNHPKQNSRGYVAEHRLVYEKYLGRFLDSNEVIHHINGNREDNRIENLQLAIENGEHIKEHHTKQRNDNGQFICSEPIFNEIKFRLFDKDKKVNVFYTLNKLISTTFRRSKFSFRGRYTGLKDKNGVEIYEGDIVYCQTKFGKAKAIIEFINGKFVARFDSAVTHPQNGHYVSYYDINKRFEVIGNIYDNPELLKESD